MGRVSTVTELPEQIREKINKMVLSGVPYDDISIEVKAMGYMISKSAIGRHSKKFVEQFDKHQIHLEQAKAMVGSFKDSLHQDEIVHRLYTQRVIDDLVSGRLDWAMSAKVISNIAKLQKVNIDRARMKKELLEKAKGVVEEVAKSKGLSDDAVSEIKTKILGI